VVFTPKQAPFPYNFSPHTPIAGENAKKGAANRQMTVSRALALLGVFLGVLCPMPKSYPR
jgi:hypothetical protein